MSATEITRRVVEQWQRAGEVLADVCRAKVAALTDEQAVAATLDLFATLDRLPRVRLRPSSGLVEQQRWFMLARRQ